MKNEFEVIRYPVLPFVNVFINKIFYRQPHLHPEYEIGLVLEGRAELFKGTTHWSLARGDLIILNPNELHEIQVKETEASFLFIQFSPRLYLEKTPDTGQILFDKQLLKADEGNSCQDLYQAILTFSVCYFESEHGKYFEALGHAYIMLHKLMERLPFHVDQSRKTGSQGRRVQRLNRFLNFVDEHYRENIALSDFSRRENVSLSYASRFVKDNLNRTFQEYVKDLRFQDAQILLAASDKNLTEISMDAGFSDLRYMNQFFQKRLGISAKEYRKRYRKRWEMQISQHGPNVEHILSLDESKKYLSGFLSP